MSSAARYRLSVGRGIVLDMTEKTEQGWTARTWLALALASWILYAVTTGFGAPGLGAVFVVLAFVCLIGLAWRLIGGR